ncbi:MAG: hypothetical protein WBP26_01410 [Candidatus Saccharimonadales bacterium]
MYTLLSDATGKPNVFPILEQNLLGISRSCWGDERYGRTALSYLASLQDGALFSVYVDNAIKDVRVNTELPADNIDVFDSMRGEGLAQKNDPQEIGWAFLAMLNNLPLPFQFSVTRSEFGHSLFRSAITGIKVEKLREYMDKSGLANHRLRGSLGKSLDALNIASGAAPLTVRQDTGPEEFLQVEGLLGRATMLDDSQKRSIIRKTAIIAMRQFRTGLPHDHGELVLEGAFSAQDAPKSLRHCAVAVESLPTIRGEFAQGIIGRFLDSVIRP